MGGFAQALSALAPIAPALSDAKQLNTDRAQQQEQFAQETELRQAQLLVQKLAAENQQQEQQRQQVIQKQLGIPFRTYKGADGGQYTDYFTPNGTKSLPDEPSNGDRLKNYFSAMESLGVPLTSEQKAEISPEFYGGRALTSKLTPLTGAAGQPQEYPKGSGNWVTFARDASNQIVAQPMPAGYTPPPPKPPTSPAGIYANLLTKQILANQKQGPPLTNEEAAQLRAERAALDEAGVARANALAQANAANHLYVVTDPTTGAETVIPVASGIAAYNHGQPFLAGAVSSPTGLDKKNQMLAQSAIQQVNRMERILTFDPNLTGPGAGQLTQLQMLFGTQDPDAQQFLISSLLGSEHGVAIFGGRNIHTIQDLNNALGSFRANPAALKAALDVIKETMTPWLTAGGRLPAPGGAPGNGKGNTSKTPTAGAKQYSLRTAMALPFNKGKTAAQVKADLEAYGYTMVP